MNSTTFGFSLTFLIISGAILIGTWFLFELWIFLISDPFIPRSEDEVPFGHSLVKYYNSIFPVGGIAQCNINFFVLLPLGFCIILSGLLFYPGMDPSIRTLTDIAAADCFDSNIILMLSATSGWSIAFFVTEILVVLALWFFLSLYTIRTVNTIWEPRAFITIVVLIGIIISIGIFIEIFAVILESM